MKRNDFADTRDISAVIVNWNTSAFLSECLASLRMSGLRPGNMVVVDQGSADDSTAMVRRSFKGVRVIKTLNLGYANGVNAGMSFVSTPYAVIANADVSVLAGCLEHLRAAIQSDETVAMAGSALYNKDLRRVTRFSKTSVTRGLLLEVIPRGLRGLWRDLEHAWHRRNTPFEVSFVEGALFMVRVRHYRNVGGMDEGFSFFFEDADLPIRMIKSGLRVCHVPAARAIHVGGASFSQVPLFHAREFYANLIRLYRRHALRRAEVLRRGLIVLTFFKSVLFSLVHTRQFAERRLRNEAIRSGLLPRQDADPSAAPLVSVIVATADRPAALEKMLLSLNGQSYGNFEIIIVDQSDRPFRWRKRRERVPMRIERLDVKNRAIAKSIGASRARGEIFLFCDDDIVAPADFVETHVRNHRSAGVGGVSCRVLEEGLPPLRSTNICKVTFYGRMRSGFQSDVVCRVRSLVGGNMSVKRKTFLEAGYFEPGFRGTAIFEEQDYSERIRSLGQSILFTNECAVWHFPQKKGNLDTRKTFRVEYYRDFHHNEMLYFLKNRPRIFLVLAVPFCLLRSFRQAGIGGVGLRGAWTMFAGVFEGIASYYRSLR